MLLDVKGKQEKRLASEQRRDDGALSAMTDRQVAFGGGAMNVIGMCADVDPPVLERQGIARAEARTVDDDAAIDSGKGDQELLEIGVMRLQIRKNLLAAIRRPVRGEAVLPAHDDAFIASGAAA